MPGVEFLSLALGDFDYRDPKPRSEEVTALIRKWAEDNPSKQVKSVSSAIQFANLWVTIYYEESLQ